MFKDVQVKSISHINYCHDVEIVGNSRVVYSPDKPLNCGAKVWIEVESDVTLKPFTFSEMMVELV